MVGFTDCSNACCRGEIRVEKQQRILISVGLDLEGLGLDRILGARGVG
jgi:hypothetical protein